ncbi:hypothetical protein FOL47_006359 [Perkinsus chesapeaki]|uniref:Uncharacterized protein n=1 Tax=Perkinsus chesapeaki TaxID=330153 RepID=A0A7J6LSD8_PERCH|nr:hypothetical protein FOL47_006359 [Perkinsus chesapeaki]
MPEGRVLEDSTSDISTWATSSLSSGAYEAGEGAGTPSYRRTKSRQNPAGQEYSANCREELKSHVECVKMFLRLSSMSGSEYAPGTQDDKADRCHNSRDVYVKCMKETRNRGPKDLSDKVVWETEPPACEAELTIHGSCVGQYLKSSILKRRPYPFLDPFYTGGDDNTYADDKCFATRAQFEKCMLKKDIKVVKYLQKAGAQCKGFVTEEVRNPQTHSREGFDLVSLDGEIHVPLARIGYDGPKVGRYGVCTDDFERSALPLLDAVHAQDKDGCIIVLDEIGKMELCSERFEPRALRVLTGDRPCLVTIAKNGGGFIAAAKKLAGIQLVEVTPSNREKLASDIALNLCRDS